MNQIQKEISAFEQRIDHALTCAESGKKVLLVCCDGYLKHAMTHILASVSGYSVDDLLHQHLSNQAKERVDHEYQLFGERLRDVGGLLTLVYPYAGKDLSDVMLTGRDYDLILLC
jgi:hypothetical protein